MGIIRRFLDWSTLTYSPSRMAWDDAYAAAWMARRSAAKRLPILGRFFRAWEEAE
jgi:hypothetical protein